MRRIISKNLIIEKLKEILDGNISRDIASKWASELRLLDDQRKLEYEDNENELIIWNAIVFIEGIDLKDAATTFLHSDKDIIEYLATFNYRVN